MGAGLLAGLLGGFGEGFQKGQQDLRKEEQRKDDQEREVLMALLHSDSPEAQRLALSTLLQGPVKGGGRKKKGGIQGWLGETEKSPHYGQLKELEGLLGGAEPGAPPPGPESFGGPPASQVETGQAVDREVGTPGAPPPTPQAAAAPPQVAGLVGAPQNPQFNALDLARNPTGAQGMVEAAATPGAAPPGALPTSQPGAPPPPAPEPFRFEGKVVPPETDDEEILGPPPEPPKGYINIPREVHAQYTQATAAHNARRKALQAERDAYRKEQHAVVTRHYENLEKEAVQQKRDAELRTHQLERDNLRDDRADARQRRTDSRIERMARDARGEASKEADRREYHRDIRQENSLFEREMTTLKRTYAPAAEVEAAKAAHEQSLKEIESSYKSSAGVAVPKDLGAGKLPAGWTIKRKQ